MNIAVFPGSFDPITIGHVSIVRRALPLFDRIVVAMGVNNSKKGLFTVEQRMAWLTATFADSPKVKVTSFEGLTVDLCKREGAAFILRGVRNGIDHDYERAIALMNRAMAGIETVLLPAEAEHAHISSTIVRELAANKADISAFVPAAVRL